MINAIWSIHILSIQRGRGLINDQQFCQHFTVHVNCSLPIINPGGGQKLCSPTTSVRSTGVATSFVQIYDSKIFSITNV